MNKAYLNRIKGMTITDIVEDKSDLEIGSVVGLVLDGTTIVWVLRDPEGNGPGFLEIQEITK